jgi:glycosyltransferase involved in cell wall biosynthesis
MGCRLKGPVRAAALDPALPVRLELGEAASSALIVSNLPAGRYDVQLAADRTPPVVGLRIWGPGFPVATGTVTADTPMTFQLDGARGYLVLQATGGQTGGHLSLSYLGPPTENRPGLALDRRIDLVVRQIPGLADARQMRIQADGLVLADAAGRDIHHWPSSGTDEAEPIAIALDRRLPDIRHVALADDAALHGLHHYPGFFFRTGEVAADQAGRPLKVGVLGHDFKFIDIYLSYLKSVGHSVRFDTWDWAGPQDLVRSREVTAWADVILCEWGLANALWASRQAPPEKPLIVRLHAQEVRGAAQRFGRRIDANQVTQLVFVSETIRQQAVDLYGWPEAITCCVPNFVLPERFELSNWPHSGEGVLTLGLVGMTPASKRLDRALDLVEALQARGCPVRLRVKGRHPDLTGIRDVEQAYYRQVFSRLENSPDLKRAVVFDAWGRDMPDWYRKVDVVLSCSDHESFHYGLADGVLAGCLPVVWPWEGAAETYSADWICASVEDAAERVLSFRSMGTEQVTDMQRANRALVKRRYGREHIFRELTKILSAPFEGAD